MPTLHQLPHVLELLLQPLHRQLQVLHASPKLTATTTTPILPLLLLAMHVTETLTMLSQTYKAFIVDALSAKTSSDKLTVSTILNSLQVPAHGMLLSQPLPLMLLFQPNVCLPIHQQTHFTSTKCNNTSCGTFAQTRSHNNNAVAITDQM